MNMRKSNDIFLVKWNNNNIVTLASKCYGCRLVIKVKTISFVYTNEQQSKVSSAHVVTKYNAYMDRVDQFQQSVSTLRVYLEERNGASLYLP